MFEKSRIASCNFKDILHIPPEIVVKVPDGTCLERRPVTLGNTFLISVWIIDVPNIDG
jgi:hypothetical protein